MKIRILTFALITAFLPALCRAQSTLDDIFKKAQQAAHAAKQIFINALTRMTFADARQILSGGDTAATDYFKKVSSDQLTVAFTPTVHKAMENVGVVRQYNQMMQNPVAASLSKGQN